METEASSGGSPASRVPPIGWGILVLSFALGVLGIVNVVLFARSTSYEVELTTCHNDASSSHGNQDLICRGTITANDKTYEVNVEVPDGTRPGSSIEAYATSEPPSGLLQTTTNGAMWLVITPITWVVFLGILGSIIWVKTRKT